MEGQGTFSDLEQRLQDKLSSGDTTGPFKQEEGNRGSVDPSAVTQLCSQSAGLQSHKRMKSTV